MGPPILDALVNYAKLPHPQRSLPAGAYLTHNEYTLTIFDLFPKAKYHFLVLPRIPLKLPSTPSSPALDLTPNDLFSLKNLLQAPSPSASRVLAVLKEAGDEVKSMIEDEMEKTEGFVWGVQMGFHAIPSMNQLHLHVISDDFVSPSLKTKKHWNSFSPDTGFFLKAEDIIASAGDGLRQLPETKEHYDYLLKQDLRCHKCKETFANIPQLKAHLEAEFEKMKEKEGRVKRRKLSG